MYAIRVTKTAESLQMLWKRFTGHCTRIIAYEHPAEGKTKRVHVHFYVEGLDVSTDTVKNWIKKTLTVIDFPKQDWSFKSADGNLKIITYMSKGRYEPIHNNGFDDELVYQYKSRWLDYAAELAKSTTVHPKKPIEEKLKVGEMLDEIQARYMHEERLAEGFDRQLDVVISIAHQVIYVENKALVGRFKFRDYVDTILARCMDKYPYIQLQKDFMRYRT